MSAPAVNSSTIRTTLFITFVAIFIATAVITLLAITDVIAIREGYLNTLFGSLVLEIVAMVIALFRRAFFLGTDAGVDPKLIVGPWWQFISERPNVALSFVQISLSPKTGHFRLEGETFTADGDRVADWRSSIAWVDPDSLQLVYLWSGNQAQVRSGELTGFGVIRFRSDDREVASRAFGWFVSPASPTAAGIGPALTAMHRVDENDQETMRGNDAAAKARLVAKIHAHR